MLVTQASMPDHLSLKVCFALVTSLAIKEQELHAVAATTTQVWPQQSDAWPGQHHSPKAGLPGVAAATKQPAVPEQHIADMWLGLTPGT